MRYGNLIALLFAAILSGCATTYGPMTMTCAAVGQAQLTSPGSRIDLRGFSVKLPDDAKKWCIGSSGKGMLVLYTHALMGHHIEKPKPRIRLNTMALGAMEFDHGSEKFETTLALKSFVEDWIKRGFGAEGEIGSIRVMRGRAQNTAVRSFNVFPSERQDAVCVQYEYEMEERDNPSAPNTILILNDYGLACQHPHTSSNIVIMLLSERYPEGDQIDPGPFPQLQQGAAQAFFDSLQF